MQSRWYHRPKLHSILDSHERKVGWLELFYDLIYVATLIQLGNALSTSFNPDSTVSLQVGILGFGALFWPMWYTWTGFTFFSNRFIIDDFLHRLMVFLQMFAIGGVAVLVPDVLEGKTNLFSFAYGSARLVLVLLYLRAWIQAPDSREISGIYVKGFAVGAAIWILSAFLPAPWVYCAWAVAMLIDVSVPFASSSINLLARKPPDMVHFTERYALLTLIVLGESFVKVLTELSALEITPARVLMCALALVITFSLWWIYFDDVAGSKIKAGRLSNLGWVYAHLPMMLAMTASGVAIKKIVLVDPHVFAKPKYCWFLCGALAIALFSVGLIDSVTERRQAELSDKARVNMRFASAAFILLLAPLGALMPAWMFVSLVSFTCAVQVLFDLAMVPLFEDEEHMHEEAIEQARERARALEEKDRLERERAEGFVPEEEDTKDAPPPRRDISDAVRRNTPSGLRRDLYFFFMEGSWWRLVNATLIIYVATNIIFAALFMAEPGSIGNVGDNSFLDAFFFSVQTMTTIGYGAMTPITTYGHVLVTIEAGFAMMGVAIITGLAFAKMARPQSGVLFSKVALFHKHHNKPTMQFRLGNARGNDVVEANMRVAVLKDELSPEGVFMRKLYDLKLQRRRTPIFALTWTVIHIIDEESPLYGISSDNISKQLGGMIVTMTGYDATYAQTTHARYTYYPEDFRFDEVFRDVVDFLPDGRLLVDYEHFHSTVPLKNNDDEEHGLDDPDYVPTADDHSKEP